MATIERDVSLLQRRRVAPIYIVYGSAVQIRLNMIDYTIPENATVEFFAQCGSGPVYRCDGSASGNSAVFTPPEGFFQPGDNMLQMEINGRLIPMALFVKCEERISGVGSEETPEQVRPLVLQAQEAAKEASSAATRAAGSASSAAGSASAAAKSETDAGNAATAAGQSANAAAGSDASAGQSANAAAGSASAALESQNAAAGSAQAAEASKNAAANSADAASGSASSAAGSASAAAGSAQEALESKNAAAGSAQAAREAMEKTQAISVNPAYIGDNGNWFVWDAERGSYVDSGVKAQGPKGDPGAVQTVCGASPDASGNVSLTAEDVGALPSTGGTMAGPIAMGGNKVTGLGTPADDGDAANKVYVDAIVGKIYPVGAIYISTNNTSPASLFGGTWERLKDRFLLAAGDTYEAGATGGEATHTLVNDEMPTHGHGVYITTSSGGTSTTGNNVVTTSWQASGQITIAGDAVPKVGRGEAHNNMPPYLAVYMWVRTA